MQPSTRIKMDKKELDKILEPKEPEIRLSGLPLNKI